MADIELHPGLHVALARTRMNETQVAKAIAAGELASPQQYANSWYFDLRLTGTGRAYRAGLKEHVWRDESLYLNQDFLDRCNGLPVIVEHPPGEMLDTKEYITRNIGSIVVPYIKGKEVWGVARILDQGWADYLRRHQVSTSPAVVFTAAETESDTIRSRDGKHLLVEGDPRLLDHVAICEEGVWDKGGPPTGVDSSEAKAKEGEMPEMDEKMKEDKEKEERADRARRDAEADKERMRAEEEEARMDAARRDEKLDKLLSGIKVLSDRMDSIEMGHEKADASAEQEDEQADKLEELAGEEREEADEEEEKEGRTDKRRMDKRRADKRRMDAEGDDKDKEEEMPWADAERKDGEEDEEYSERMDAMAATGAPSYRKRKDESFAAHCDRVARGARRDRAMRADRARMDSIDKIGEVVGKLIGRVDRLAQVTADRTPEDENAFAQVQVRADAVYQAHGEAAPRPLAGQNLMGYRIMLLRGVQKHSAAWKDSDMGAIARTDAAAFNNVEGMVYADAQRAALAPAEVVPGRLRAHSQRLPSGHTVTNFQGDPLAWMSTYMAMGRTTRRLHIPTPAGR